MDRLLPDLAHSFRRLRRAPAFALIAILTLALGIGANTAIFSLVKAVLLQPLPFGTPERLVMLWGDRSKGETTWLSGPEIQDYQRQGATFTDVAAYTSSAANLTGGQEPARVITAVVTPNLFATLRVAPLIGRTFLASDSADRIADQVILSHGLWQSRFGARPEIIGERIQVNGQARVVIGVMPASFKLPLDFSDERPSEMWTPLDLRPFADSWGDHSFIGVARLQDNVTPQLANATMARLEDKWVAEGSWSNRSLAARVVVPMKELIIGDVRYALWVLLGAVGVILLIACANVANLMLARSDDRHREIAVRTALGASRQRVVQQLLTESVLLSVIGGAFGLALAYAGMQLILALNPSDLPRVENMGLDVPVLAFTLLLTVATGILFGLAPALELSRPDLNRSLKEGGRTGTVGRARQRFRDSLAVAQMAFSVVLLIGAVLLVRSFFELRRIDVGFRSDNALTIRTALPVATYPRAENVIGFYRTLRQKLGEMPGVQMVGATRLLPLTGTIGDWSITIEGRPTQPGENPNGDWQVVTPGYFETMGMKLVRGRFFSEADNENAPIAAVVNETMAKRYWPTTDAIGKRFHIGSADQPWITIVGIVGQVRHNTLTESARAEMYVPHAQWGVAGANPPRGLTFVIRTTGDPLGVLAYVRQTVRALDPNLPIADIRTLAQVESNSLSQARFTTLLLGLFAALALTLATIGIYGVISLLVTRRRQEIGIRIALGARPGMILGMVVGRGMALAGVGVAVGLVAAVLLSQVVASLLYGVTRFDPVTFVIVPAVLATVALLACLIPAGRAATLDPVVALREE
jgi:putative ABC transport system permease protein